MNQFMKIALETAREGMRAGRGGPFGAAIVKDGELVCAASNEVLCSNDPTAHAEITAIRGACQKLGTYDLSGCVIYSTGYPCPMCLSAIIWANIKECYFALTTDDAEQIGFRDEPIYRHIRGEEKMLSIGQLDREECVGLFQEYASAKRKIY